MDRIDAGWGVGCHAPIGVPVITGVGVGYPGSSGTDLARGGEINSENKDGAAGLVNHPEANATPPNVLTRR